MPGNIPPVNNAPRVQSEQKHCTVTVAQLAKNSPVFTEIEVMALNISKFAERETS